MGENVQQWNEFLGAPACNQSHTGVAGGHDLLQQWSHPGIRERLVSIPSERVQGFRHIPAEEQIGGPELRRKRSAASQVWKGRPASAALVVQSSIQPSSRRSTKSSSGDWSRKIIYCLPEQCCKRLQRLRSLGLDQ